MWEKLNYSKDDDDDDDENMPNYRHQPPPAPPSTPVMSPSLSTVPQPALSRTATSQVTFIAPTPTSTTLSDGRESSLSSRSNVTGGSEQRTPLLLPTASVILGRQQSLHGCTPAPPPSRSSSTFISVTSSVSSSTIDALNTPPPTPSSIMSLRESSASSQPDISSNDANKEKKKKSRIKHKVLTKENE